MKAKFTESSLRIWVLNVKSRNFKFNNLSLVSFICFNNAPGRFSKLYAGNIVPTLAHFVLQGIHVSALYDYSIVASSYNACFAKNWLVCLIPTHMRTYSWVR
jgi:hypothetical protein